MNSGQASNSRHQSAESKIFSPLDPAAEFTTIMQGQTVPPDESDQIPGEIQRPRSALHKGDFTEDLGQADVTSHESPRGSRYLAPILNTGPLGISPTTPWYTPPSSFQPFGASSKSSLTESNFDSFDRRPWRSRAPSLQSYSSSSYVLKAPTTPLVQQSNSTDFDFLPQNRSISPEKNTRRHTMNVFSSSDSQAPNVSQGTRHVPSYRREGTFPYGHHARRSLTSSWSLQASTSPQTPAYLRSRRTSFSSEISPLQHASMVGSYEESILRGWMSTAPSKPLDFTAQIGVLGKGNCKPKCPAHVTIAFPAVFYSWNAGNGRSAVTDDPSPYVGHIDLQNHLTSEESRQTLLRGAEAGADEQVDNSCLERDADAPEIAFGKSNKRRRTSPASLAPKGSYRIPQQGQLQIIIKNPNKTAVKLFLVPYDLTGMEPGTKTFVRQRSYSADPVTNSLVASKAQSSPVFVPRKPTLRYLIHLNICSPSKGRFYLYQQIRVVFANRVPDNKEQLRNDIQVPGPRFSVYKPIKDSLSSFSSSARAKLTADKAYRRRSSGFGSGGGEIALAVGSTFSFNSGAPVLPIPTIPLNLAVSKQTAKQTNDDDGADADGTDLDASRPTTASDLRSPASEKGHRVNGVQLSSSYKSSSSSQGSDGYNKLSRGDCGYGGVFGRPGTPEAGEGLLAMRLKGWVYSGKEPK